MDDCLSHAHKQQSPVKSDREMHPCELKRTVSQIATKELTLHSTIQSDGAVDRIRKNPREGWNIEATGEVGAVHMLSLQGGALGGNNFAETSARRGG